MKNIKFFAAFVLITILLSSCATIFYGEKDKMTFNSTPSGATVYINGKNTNRNTPCDIYVKKEKYIKRCFFGGFNPTNFEINYELKKEGYKPFQNSYMPQRDIAYGNGCLIPLYGIGILGFAVDAATNSSIVFNHQFNDNLEIDKNYVDTTEIESNNVPSQLVLPSDISSFPRLGGFGFRLGLNFANIASDAKDANYKMKLGYLVGITSGGAFGNSKFGGQFSLLYSTKGAKMDFNEQGIKATATASYNYLTLPFNFFYVFGNEDYQFYPCLGFYSAYTLSGKIEGSAGGISVSEKLDIGMDSDLSPMDFGYTLGFCAELKKIQISLQYEKGIYNTMTGGVRELNSIVSLSTAYLFNKKK